MARTQAERRAGTQEALFAATIDCLVELGYANTTTREVAQRAGVSRGAQTHHFPTKTDLVLGAIEHLFAQQAARYRAAFTALPPAERTLERAVGLLWDVVSGPSYPAVLEVTVAARTDPALRVVVHGMATVLEQTMVGLLTELFPDFSGDPTDGEKLARTIVDLGFTVVQGAAVSSYAGYGDPERTIRLTRALAALITPDTVGLVRGILDVTDP
jgi:AcrR family transcriptional regulator